MDVGRLSLIYFYFAQNLKDLNLNKYFERLSSEGLIVCPATYWSDQNVPNICCLRFEIRQQGIKEIALIYKKEQSPA